MYASTWSYSEPRFSSFLKNALLIGPSTSIHDLRTSFLDHMLHVLPSTLNITLNSLSFRQLCIFGSDILSKAYSTRTLCTVSYVTFLHTKSPTLRKKQEHLRYIFIYKIPETFHYATFMEFLKFMEGEGHFYILKTMHFALHFYMQKKCTLCYVLYIYNLLYSTDT